MDFWPYQISALLFLTILLLVQYYLLFRFLRSTSIFFSRRKVLSVVSSFATIILLNYFIFIQYSSIEYKYLEDRPYVANGIEENEWVVRQIQGKVAIQAPETLAIFKKNRVIVRIARLDLTGDVFFERLGRYPEVALITDTLLISSVMRVSLKETTEEKKMEIVRLNNNEKQFIDTSKFTEWTFSIRAVDYGKVTLAVSISGLIKTDFGDSEIDCPIYEKEFSITATEADKFRVLWNKYSWFSVAIVLGFFLLLYKLIPNQTIIDYHMPNTKQTNFWNAGALGLIIYLITIVSIIVFKIVEISLIYVPLVFIGTVLIYAAFTAVGLRDNEKLSEENFLKLMTLAVKKLPPFNLIFKERRVE